MTKPLREPELLARLGAHWRNGRLTRLARAAVDIAGRGVVLVDDGGRIGWCSSRARQWLDALGLESLGGHGVGRPAAGEAGAGGMRSIPLPDGLSLQIRHLGAVGHGETMLLLECRAAGRSPAAPLAALTPRETEVLSWLARGKTNRDIADILGISRHTVGKHLEHLFEKLGVETRSAATAIAARQGLTLD